jgi:hypothetical protein
MDGLLIAVLVLGTFVAFATYAEFFLGNAPTAGPVADPKPPILISAPAEDSGGITQPPPPPPAQYGGGNVWWLGVVLGVFAGLASAAVGGGGSPEGAVVAIALNPLVWFGCYSLFKIRPALRCPHCRRTEAIPPEFRNARLGSIATCPHCGNEFQKVT